jgi:outer membrane protein assembly factor BamB
VLIADRNNNRIVIVSPGKRIVWSDTGLRGPDDAFFTPGFRSVITNEEFNDTLTEVSLRTHQAIWRYGHSDVAGSGPGYLDTPDDAYRLRDGWTTVADIRNCRVVELNHRRKVVRVIGGSCVHDPPSGLASPNGATPLPDGGLLVTEIPGWIDRISASGRLLWSLRSPVSYPSDAQLLPDGRILVASFTSPGRIVEVTRQGRVTWSFGAATGPNLLDKPSLAVRWPNGMIAANDDYGQRVIVIDPRTKRIVWQYGHTGVASAAPGYLSKPDGIDLLPALQVGRPRPALVVRRVRLRRIGGLPGPMSSLAVAPFGAGRVVALGGLSHGDVSTDTVLAGTPGALHVIGRLPLATHDDAAVALPHGVYLLGGGQSASSDAIVRVSRNGDARRVGSLGEPLSDLGAAVVGKAAYIVGGYTGVKYATGILAFGASGSPRLVARLPVGLRYAGVAALGGRVYVAGGITTAGPSDAVYEFDPATRSVSRIGSLPFQDAHAPLAALDGALYLFGGDGHDQIVRVTPAGTATVVGRLPEALSGAAALTVGAGIDLFGGAGSSAVYRVTTGSRAGAR